MGNILQEAPCPPREALCLREEGSSEEVSRGRKDCEQRRNLLEGVDHDAFGCSEKLSGRAPCNVVIQPDALPPSAVARAATANFTEKNDASSPLLSVLNTSKKQFILEAHRAGDSSGEIDTSSRVKQRF